MSSHIVIIIAEIRLLLLAGPPHLKCPLGLLTMPTYKFKDNNSGEEFEKWMYMADREKYLADNPNVTQMPTLLHAVSEVGNWQNKTDSDWKTIVNRAANVTGSNVDRL